MSLSSSTTLAPSTGPSHSHAPPHHHHHVAHGHHARGGKRRMSSTASHGLHRTRSHASTTGLSEHSGTTGGHALQRTSSHGGGPRTNALAALQGMTAAPAMARQRSTGSNRSGSSENVRNAGKGKKRTMSRIENHRSASSGTIAKLHQQQQQHSASSAAMHRSQTEPVTTGGKDGDEEWESGDEASDDGDGDAADGALELNIGKKGSRAGSRAGSKAGSKAGSRAESKVGSRERERDTVPPESSVSRRDDPVTGLPPTDGQPLKRTATIGFDVVGLQERKEGEAAAPRERTMSGDAVSPRVKVGSVLGEPSLEKAGRTQFITSPEKDTQSGAALCTSPGTLGTTPRDEPPQPFAARKSSVPFPTSQPSGDASYDSAPLPKPTRQPLRTRTSHTSLRSLQSFRAPPHPLSSPSSAHPRSRVSSGAARRETGMAEPVVNKENVQGSRPGSMEDVDQLGALGGNPARRGLPRSASSKSAFGLPTLERQSSAAEGFLRKASFSSVRDTLPGSSGSGTGGTSTPGIMSKTPRLSAREAAQAAARIAALPSGPQPSASGTGTLGRLASVAAGTSAQGARSRAAEYDQSHLVSRFIADKPKSRRHRHAHPGSSTTPPSEDAPSHSIFPETPFSRAHAALVLGMRREKQTLQLLQSSGVLSRTPSSAGLSRQGYAQAQALGLQGSGAGQDARSLPVPAGLSPFELSMQRVLAQRAVAVSTSGLAGLGLEG